MRLHLGKAIKIIREYYGNEKVDAVFKTDAEHYLVRFKNDDLQRFHRNEVIEMFDKINAHKIN